MAKVYLWMPWDQLPDGFIFYNARQERERARVDGANAVHCVSGSVYLYALLELVCGKVAKIMGHIAHYNIHI